MSAAIVTPIVPEAAAPAIERPCYRVYEHTITLDGVKLRPGVWYHGQSPGQAKRRVSAVR